MKRRARKKSLPVVSRSPGGRLTDKACPRCLPLALAGKIDVEMVQRMPEGAWAPLSRDGSGKCCRDCAAAEVVMANVLPGLEQGDNDTTAFVMARIAVGNDRMEQYRLPGIPMGLVLAGYVKPSAPGDHDDHLAWLDRNFCFGLCAHEEHKGAVTPARL